MADQNADLQCVKFQIFPNQNRYQAFVSDGNKDEFLIEGQLEKLTRHLTQLKDFCTGGTKVNVRLQWPKGFSFAPWFSKATFRRFLSVVNSSEVFNGTKVIEDEISQLEKSRKFHLSLYSQYESEVEITSSSSDSSKNELLRAMDLRLKVLRNELAASLEQVAGSCSSKDISHLLLCCQNLGAVDLKNYLIKYSELNQIMLILDNPCDGKPTFVNDVGRAVESETRTGTKRTKSKLDQPVVLVDHSSLSSKANLSSNATDEDLSSDLCHVVSTERIRSLWKNPRGSASPMSRVQIARVGSHRSAAIDIKNLNHFVVREKTPNHADKTANNSDGEISGKPQRKLETNGRKMNVQSVSSFFESTQRKDNAVSDIGKRSPGDKPKNVKPVRRKWNYVDQYHMHCTVEGDTDNDSLTSVASSSDTKAQEVGSEEQDSIEFPALNPHDDIKATQVKKGTDRLIASADWNQQREAEFSMLKKMIEVKPVKNRRHGASKNNTSEQRGSFYNDYRRKRDEKLKGKHAAKKVEREAQFKAINQIVESKVQMSSKDSKRQPVRKVVSSATPLSPQSLNTTKEIPKGTTPTAGKREAMRPSSDVPATPQSRKLSPLGNSNTGPSAATTTCRKSQPPTSLTSLYSKVEKSLPRKNALPTEPSSCLQGTMSRNSQPVKRDNDLSNPEIRASPENLTYMVPDKNGVPNKGAKTNSVVPVESKSFIQRVSKVGSASITNDSKCETSPRSKEHVRKSGNIPCNQEREVEVQSPEQVDKHEIKDILCVHVDSTLPEILVNDQQKTVAPKAPSKDNANGSTNMAAIASPFSVKKEETSISPSAWVEVEESSDLPVMPIPIDDSEVQFSYPQRINAVFHPKHSLRGFKRFLKCGGNSKDGNSSGRHYTSIKVTFLSIRIKELQV